MIGGEREFGIGKASMKINSLETVGTKKGRGKKQHQ